jgi:hypothetical protein
MSKCGKRIGGLVAESFVLGQALRQRANHGRGNQEVEHRIRACGELPCGEVG